MTAHVDQALRRSLSMVEDMFVYCIAGALSPDPSGMPHVMMGMVEIIVVE
jgi:hypothetical protein